MQSILSPNFKEYYQELYLPPLTHTPVGWEGCRSGGQMQELNLYFRKYISNVPHHWTPRNATELEGPEFVFQIYFPHCDMQIFCQ